MDVLRYFEVDQTLGANFGKLAINSIPHSVQLPVSNTVEPIGASLVVMYRDENQPLRAVVIYDGSFAIDESTNGMQLTMKGFYDGTPGPAKLAIIGGNRQGESDENHAVQRASVVLQPASGHQRVQLQPRRQVGQPHVQCHHTCADGKQPSRPTRCRCRCRRRTWGRSIA